MPKFILDIGRDDDQRVQGRLAREGRWAMPFSGWLELLQLLEDLGEDPAKPLPDRVTSGATGSSGTPGPRP